MKKNFMGLVLILAACAAGMGTTAKASIFGRGGVLDTATGGRSYDNDYNYSYGRRYNRDRHYDNRYYDNGYGNRYGRRYGRGYRRRGWFN